jgi:hypothetical protein
MVLRASGPLISGDVVSFAAIEVSVSKTHSQLNRGHTFDSSEGRLVDLVHLTGDVLMLTVEVRPNRLVGGAQFQKYPASTCQQE